jgi:hypothetical protein
MNFLHLGTLLDLNGDEGLETGSPTDMRSRLEALLPAGWFPYPSFFTGLSLSDILDGALTGAATGFSFVYGLLQYVRSQTRLASMSGGWLDLASYDFFNYGLLRLPNEIDGAFLVRIIKEFLRIRNTRPGIISMVTDITGRAPKIVEPWSPQDCGAWDDPSPIGATTPLAYDVSGAWGEDSYTAYTYGPDAGAGYGEQPMICQSFVTVYRPTDNRPYSDAMVYAGLERVRACGTIIWVKFSNFGTTMATSGGDDIVDESGDLILVESYE